VKLQLSGILPSQSTHAPVNELVSLTWLLEALRSFRRFTLHYKVGAEPDLVESKLNHRLPLTKMNNSETLSCTLTIEMYII